MREHRNGQWGDSTQGYSPLMTDRHPLSRRHALFEDDGASAWLYLTEATTLRPVADVWVYSRHPVPPPGQASSLRAGPYPAPTGDASRTAQGPHPDATAWSFLWSRDGQSVALVRDTTPMAFVTSRERHGHSRYVDLAGAWGEPWSEALWRDLFTPGDAQAVVAAHPVPVRVM